MQKHRPLLRHVKHYIIQKSHAEIIEQKANLLNTCSFEVLLKGLELIHVSCMYMHNIEIVNEYLLIEKLKFHTFLVLRSGPYNADCTPIMGLYLHIVYSFYQVLTKIPKV